MDETTPPYIPPAPEPAPGSADLVITPEAQHYLHQAGRWAKFLGIMGFIYTALLVLGGFGASRMSGNMNQFSQAPGGVVQLMSTFGMFFYLIGALIAFFLSLYLYQFGDRIKSGISYADTGLVTGGFEKLKSFFKFYGILVIIALAFVLLVLIGVFVGIGMMSNMNH